MSFKLNPTSLLKSSIFPASVLASFKILLGFPRFLKKFTLFSWSKLSTYNYKFNASLEQLCFSNRSSKWGGFMLWNQHWEFGFGRVCGCTIFGCCVFVCRVGVFNSFSSQIYHVRQFWGEKGILLGELPESHNNFFFCLKLNVTYDFVKFCWSAVYFDQFLGARHTQISYHDSSTKSYYTKTQSSQINQQYLSLLISELSLRLPQEWTENWL